MNTLRTKKYPLGTLEYLENDNILFYRVKQGIEIDIYEITEMIKYVEEFMGNKKHYAVVDFGSNVMSTTEARKVYADSKYIQTYRIADAFLVKSLPLRLVANFFINITKPKVVTQLFTNEESAIKWLKSNKLTHV